MCHSREMIFWARSTSSLDFGWGSNRELNKGYSQSRFWSLDIYVGMFFLLRGGCRLWWCEWWLSSMLLADMRRAHICFRFLLRVWVDLSRFWSTCRRENVYVECFWFSPDGSTSTLYFFSRRGSAVRWWYFATRQIFDGFKSKSGFCSPNFAQMWGFLNIFSQISPFESIFHHHEVKNDQLEQLLQRFRHKTPKMNFFERFLTHFHRCRITMFSPFKNPKLKRSQKWCDFNC